MQKIQERLTELNVDNEFIDNVMSYLSAPADFKLYNRLQVPVLHAKTNAAYRVMVLDTETTGVDTISCEMIELAYCILEFTREGELGNVVSEYNGLQQPRFGISNSDIHGIYDEDVVDKAFDTEQINQDINSVNLVIAHNAGFDRRVVERYFPLFERVPWACSYRDSDFNSRGISSHKLEFLAFSCGFFYKAHRALTDVYATIEILRRLKLFPELLQAALSKQYIIYAKGAPFKSKDSLKERRYKPNYVNGKFICWYTTVAQKDLEVEKDWLRRIAGCSSTPVKEVTAKDRYSVREEL